MEVTTSMITVYCFVDDWFKEKHLRQRRPQLALRNRRDSMAQGSGKLYAG